MKWRLRQGGYIVRQHRLVKEATMACKVTLFRASELPKQHVPVKQRRQRRL